MLSFKEFLIEGGWASQLTQNTKITPKLVEHAVEIIKDFTRKLNVHLHTKGIPPVEFGAPAGSTTYYKRDLEHNPAREYGDIDVNLFIPRIDGMSNAANESLFKREIKEFCEHNHEFRTENGTNVIINIGAEYIQVDFIMAYIHNKEWTKALAPEYNVKGVLCNSLYSALGEALHLSFGGGHGIQAKKVNNELVPFRTIKDTKLHTISTNPKTWAIDIAKFFGCTKMSARLLSNPGMNEEVKISDIVESFKGIAETLEINGKLPRYPDAYELLSAVKSIYQEKINKVINSTKFEKASTAAAIEKAEKTKKELALKSAQIVALL